MHDERRPLFVSCFCSFTVSLVTVTTSRTTLPCFPLFFSPFHTSSRHAQILILRPLHLQNYLHISGFLHTVQSLPALLHHAHGLGSVDNEAARMHDPVLFIILYEGHLYIDWYERVSPGVS